MPTPLIQVIVLNYNGKRFLERCVRTVLDSRDVRLRLLVVDNASTDGSVEAVPSLTPGADPRVTVLRNPKNLYFARGNNVGIRLTLEQSPDYVFILNNDTELPPDCLKRLTTFMEETPHAAGCQPVLLFQSHPTYVNSRGCRCSLSGKTWDAGFAEPYAPASEPQEVLGVTGGAMFLRADVLRRIGGFCDYFSMYSEDVDLSLRIRAAGGRLYCVPDATLLHAYGGTALNSMPMRRLFYCERNSFYVVLRNFPLSRIAKSYLLCTPLRLLIAANAAVRGRWRYALAVLGGTAVGLGALPLFLGKRALERLGGKKRDWRFWAQMDEDRLIPPKPRPLGG